MNVLIKKAKDLRIKTLEAFIKKGEAHLGGSFSIIEILIFLYEKVLKKKGQIYFKQISFFLPIMYSVKRKRT